MTRAGLLLDLAEVAEELCDPHRHAEPVYDNDRHRNKRMRRVHVTTQPGLLRQLADMFAPTSSAIDDGSGRSTPGSRAPAHLDALCRHTAITFDVTRWCWELRLSIRDTVEGNVRALVGAAGSLPSDDDVYELLAVMRRWRSWARIVTGWDSPPYQPHVSCPDVDCGQVALRIHLARQTALCVACGSTWDPSTIGVLADYVRSVRDHSPRS